MRPKPYIGITGFMHRREIYDVLAGLPDDSTRQVMIGILVSSKTLRGQPNKWPCRYPKIGLIPGILTEGQNALNLLHFNTKETESEKIATDMIQAQYLAQSRCHGFQLNIAWPEADILRRYKRTSFERKTIVLQCGGHALDAVGRSGARLADKVREYEGLIDYVLIDPSGGFGQDFDLELARDCFRHLKTIPTIGFGIAGGLSPSNLNRLHELLRYFPNFSIDAEGKLRTSEDDLDVELAREYLQVADLIFRQYEHIAA